MPFILDQDVTATLRVPAIVVKRFGIRSVNVLVVPRGPV